MPNELTQAYLGQISAGYAAARADGAFGDQPFGQMQPWHLLPNGKIFDVAKQWPSGGGENPLIAFAVRQDCDDIACLEIVNHGEPRVVLIHGWTSAGYDVMARYSFGEWMKSVAEDNAEWRSRATS